MNDNKPIIMSLGYNCEISFRIEDYFGKLDSYLYSWSFEEDRNAFLQSLQAIDSVFTGKIELQPDHMFRDEVYKIKFHPRYDILPKTGEVSLESYEKGLDELKERLEHLKQKTTAVFSGKRPIVFIMKVENKGVENNEKYILEAVEVLKKTVRTHFILVVVMEKKAVTSELLHIQSDVLLIRTLKKFAPVKHTDVIGDTRGWYKILREVTKCDSKCYFSNLKKRQRKIYPQIIMNKLAKTL